MKIKPSGTKRVIKQDYTIPEGFVLTIDTREQDNLFRKPPKGLLIVRDTLRAGDYSCKGFENAISIERKGLNDFYGSIGNGRDRFRRELELLKGYQWAGLVIEADEYHAHMLELNPQLVVLTNITPDHLDYSIDEEKILHFVQNNQQHDWRLYRKMQLTSDTWSIHICTKPCDHSFSARVIAPCV